MTVHALIQIPLLLLLFLPGILGHHHQMGLVVGEHGHGDIQIHDALAEQVSIIGLVKGPGHAVINHIAPGLRTRIHHLLRRIAGCGHLEPAYASLDAILEGARTVVLLKVHVVQILQDFRLELGAAFVALFTGQHLVVDARTALGAHHPEASRLDDVVDRRGLPAADHLLDFLLGPLDAVEIVAVERLLEPVVGLAFELVLVEPEKRLVQVLQALFVLGLLLFHLGTQLLFLLLQGAHRPGYLVLHQRIRTELREFAHECSTASDTTFPSILSTASPIAFFHRSGSGGMAIRSSMPSRMASTMFMIVGRV